MSLFLLHVATERYIHSTCTNDVVYYCSLCTTSLIDIYNVLFDASKSIHKLYI